MLERLLRHNLKIGAGRDVQLAAWVMLALAAGFIAYIARTHEITHDAFHEMALFREALVLGHVPQQDVFAYTPTVDPSVHHEWGTGAILYFATLGTGLGLAGLSLLKLLLIAGLWLTLYRVARMRGAHPIVFACFAIAVFPVMWVGFATVRAQLFTLLFLALQLWMQELDIRGKRAWVLAWLAMLTLWLNLHAGFVVGMGLLAFHALERLAVNYARTRSIGQTLAATWHVIAAGLASICVLPINPYGWKYIPYLVHAIGMQRPLIREWKPIWHTYSPGITIFMLLLAATVFAYAARAYWVRRPSRERLRGAAFLTLCFYMTIKHIRHGSLMAVVWLAYVPAWITRTPLGHLLVRLVEDNRKHSIRLCQAITVACLIFASVHHFWRPSLPPQPLYSTACYPTGAVAFMRAQQFSGKLLTPFHVGAYVSWELYPEVKVSFDGRYEVAYQAGVMEAHNAFLSGEGNWSSFLDQYPTDAMLVHKQAPVYPKLQLLWTEDAAARPSNMQGWYAAYEDDSFIVVASPEVRLQTSYRVGQPMQDGAWEAFSPQHAHFNRDAPRVVAAR